MVGIVHGQNRCQNSIVCLEKHASQYGDGPDAIDSEIKLHCFLTFLGWQNYFSIEKHRGGLLTTPSFGWPIAYVYQDACFSSLQPGESGYLTGPAQRLHIGPSGLARGYLDDSSSIKVEGGHLVISGLYMLKFTAQNQFAEAANWAEGDLAPDLERPVDRSQQQIRSAISQDGGAAYLSDGEWL